MRIALYATTILELGGGLEKYFIETAHGLSEFSDIHIDVVTLDDSFTKAISRILDFYYFKKVNVSIYREPSESIKKKLGTAQYYKCKNFKELRERLHTYDIIYSKNEILEALVLGFCIGFKSLPPVMFGCHTPIYYPSAESFHAKLHNWLYNGMFYRWLVRDIRGFHVTNNFDKELLQKFFPTKSVHKIYDPFDIKESLENSQNYIYPFDWDSSRFNILWVARVTEQKGIVSLVQIVERLNKTIYGKKIIFNIVGNGDLEHLLVDLKKRADNVNLFGYVEHKYISSIYRNNNLFISTSKWESLGLNILEAQACGIPVVAFNIPGPQDIIINNETGFLVKDIDDFCEKVIEIEEKQKKFDEQVIMRNIVRFFSPNTIYRELIGMFEMVKKFER